MHSILSTMPPRHRIQGDLVNLFCSFFGYGCGDGVSAPQNRVLVNEGPTLNPKRYIRSSTRGASVKGSQICLDPAAALLRFRAF